MPSISWSTRALNDLNRLEAFLAIRDPEAARAAVALVFNDVPQLTQFPAIGRPVATLPAHFRERIIRFGKGAFVLRYRVTADHIVLLAIRHSREAGF